MPADKMTRLLLGLILLCLLVLIVQSFGGAGSGRFQVTGMRAGSPVLIRTDTETGKVWKLELRGGGDRWIPFSEPGDAGAAANASAQAPMPGVATGTDRSGAAALPSALSGVRGGEPPTEAEIQLFIDTLVGGELPADVRVWTARQLGPIDRVEVTNALLAALDAPEPEVVAAAVAALSQRDDPRIAPALEGLAARGGEAPRADLRIETLD